MTSARQICIATPSCQDCLEDGHVSSVSPINVTLRSFAENIRTNSPFPDVKEEACSWEVLAAM